MAFKNDRARPKAQVLTGKQSYRDRLITLFTGRGDTQITAAEARALAADLIRSAEVAESLVTRTERPAWTPR